MTDEITRENATANIPQATTPHRDGPGVHRIAIASAAVATLGLGALAAVLLVAPRGPDPLTTGSISAPPVRAAAVAMPDIDATIADLPRAPEDVAPAPAPAAIAAPAALPAFAAVRDAGALRLTGSVASEAERAAILSFAQQRFLAEPVIDEMAVDAAAAPTPEPVTQAALGALARLAEGQARLADGALVVEGRTLYRQVAGRLEADLGAQLPEGWQARLSVSLPEAAPEPTIAPFPGRAASATAPAVPGDARAPGARPAALTQAAFTPEPAAETASPEAIAPAEAVILPPLPQRASLEGLENHPLPPRR